MQLVVDNIIFALQRTGGISVVWNEHLKRVRADIEIQLIELDYVGNKRFLERYRYPQCDLKEPTVFHSSYFRVCPSDLAYNVTTVHDLTYHFYRKGVAKMAHLWEEERALRHSKAIICVSENTKRDLMRFYPWIKEKQIHVVYNGVSDEFHPIPSVQKQGYLLFIGNSRVAYKRYDVAQEVARLTGLPLVTAANVSQEQLNTMYNEASCLLYPSDYEGFGLPILEAQKVGCPVIAQNTSSIPEVIGENGLMVAHDTPHRMAEQMAERVRDLLSRPTKEIIEAGLENAKRFSWDKTYEQTKQVYKTLIN